MKTDKIFYIQYTTMETAADSSKVTSLVGESKTELTVNSGITQPTVRNERTEKGRSKYLLLNLNANN